MQEDNIRGTEAERALLRLQRCTAIPTLVLPLAGAVAAVWRLAQAPAWAWAMCFALYTVSMLGITVGYHRLFTHRSFEADGWLRGCLAIMGCLAAEGPPAFWVATHRRHHQHAESDQDPHSPHAPQRGWRGFWHAHAGWMMTVPPAAPLHYAPDLLRDRLVAWVGRHYLLFVGLGIVLPAAAGALIGGASGALDGLIFGGLLRMFLVQHVTWSINSVCHLWGSQPHRAKGASRNHAVLGLLAFGEGWHNNHHAAAASARHGWHWWQIDFSWGFIRLLRAFGLARNVRLADPAKSQPNRQNHEYRT
ncbi:MAG: fatty acid desaturase [Burkholderiales bacterium]|nr:fatty acid desaturase [Burkholderiales bacterium]